LVLERSLASLVPAEPLLGEAGAGLDPRDRRLLAELVYGALRWLSRIDHVLSAAAGRAVADIDTALLPVLRIAAVQLLTLDRIPPHAAVSEAVDEARRRGGRGAAGFVNAVLRRIARSPRFDDWPIPAGDPVARLAIETSHPEEMVARWWNRFGEEATRRVAAASNESRPLHLLAFFRHGGRSALAEELEREGTLTRPSSLSPLGLTVEEGRPLAGEAFRRGHFYVQDEASQAAALIPPPRPGELVLDAASAPGGKGIALSAAEPGVAVLFADRSLARMRTLDENLSRLGMDAWRVVADAVRPPVRRRFDRVLLDAPCSGTGTLRRHPELRWRFRSARLAEFADETVRMLEALCECVAEDGILQLVTCSIEAEENEAVVDRFLESRSDFERFDLTRSDLPPGDSSALARGMWRTLPGAGHDGFTVHVLHRAR